MWHSHKILDIFMTSLCKESHLCKHVFWIIDTFAKMQTNLHIYAGIRTHSHAEIYIHTHRTPLKVLPNVFAQFFFLSSKQKQNICMVIALCACVACVSFFIGRCLVHHMQESQCGIFLLFFFCIIMLCTLYCCSAHHPIKITDF